MTDPTEAPASPAEPPTPRWKTALKVIAGLAVLAGILYLGRLGGGYVPEFRQWVEGVGFWGPAVFVLGYAVATVAFLPGSLLTLAAGATFGIVEGTLWAFAGATVGSSASFLIARYAARGAVERRMAGNARMAAIDRAVAAEGRRIVFLLRLVPVIPFNALNYGLGLTKVAFRDYLVACLGMLPGTLLYVYSGKVAGDVAELASGAPVSRGGGYWALIGLGLAATIAVTVIVTRTARRALAEATASPDLASADLGMEG